MLSARSAQSPDVVFVVPTLQTVHGLFSSLFTSFGQVKTHHHPPISAVNNLVMGDGGFFGKGPLGGKRGQTLGAI